MIVYRLDPIDNGWMPWDALIARAPKPKTSPDYWDQDWFDLSPDASVVRSTFARAQHLAKRLGWEGDIREGPYFAPLPENDTHPSAFLLAWKQDNNGATFVASPFNLPWLDKSCDDRIAEDKPRRDNAFAGSKRDER